MIRDKRKSKEYFDDYIEKEMENFHEFAELLHDKSILNERLHLLMETLFDYKFDTIIAKYSRGDSMEEIALEYEKLLEIWKEMSDRESLESTYEENLWFLSLGILLGEQEKMKQIEQKLKESGINDWLFNFLLSDRTCTPEQIEGELMIPEKYQTLQKAICNSDKQLLIHYLEKEWYANCKDFGWYDSHKLKRKSQSIYFGYWCFEAAAVVKKMGWSDEELLEQEYYPYDLAHYQ